MTACSLQPRATQKQQQRVTEHAGLFLKAQPGVQGQGYWAAHQPWTLKGYEGIAQPPDRLQAGFLFHGAKELPTAELLERAWYRDFGREIKMQDNLALATAARDGMIVTMTASTGGTRLRTFS